MQILHYSLVKKYSLTLLPSLNAVFAEFFSVVCNGVILNIERIDPKKTVASTWNTPSPLSHCVRELATPSLPWLKSPP